MQGPCGLGSRGKALIAKVVPLRAHENTRERGGETALWLSLVPVQYIQVGMPGREGDAHKARKRAGFRNQACAHTAKLFSHIDDFDTRNTLQGLIRREDVPPNPVFELSDKDFKGAKDENNRLIENGDHVTGEEEVFNDVRGYGDNTRQTNGFQKKAESATLFWVEPCRRLIHDEDLGIAHEMLPRARVFSSYPAKERGCVRYDNLEPRRADGAINLREEMCLWDFFETGKVQQGFFDRPQRVKTELPGEVSEDFAENSGSFTMSRLSERMAPEMGLGTFASRRKRVIFPAPFGPRSPYEHPGQYPN